MSTRIAVGGRLSLQSGETGKVMVIAGIRYRPRNWILPGVDYIYGERFEKDRQKFNGVGVSRPHDRLDR